MKANETKGTRSPIAPTDGRRSAGGGRGAHRDLDGEEVAVGLRCALRDADLARRAEVSRGARAHGVPHSGCRSKLLRLSIRPRRADNSHTDRYQVHAWLLPSKLLWRTIGG